MPPRAPRTRRSKPASVAPGSRVARRAELRRRRRRLGGLVGALIALAVVAAAALTGGSGSRVRPGRHSPLSPRARAPRASGAHASLATAVSVGSTVDRLLRRTSYVQLAGRRRRDVALTFDDGPGPFTSRIIRILRRTHTPATFFLIGRAARTYPHLVATEVRDRFAVGDHTETHPMMAALSASAQAKEIAAAAADIHRAGAPYPRLFRPPFGSFNQATLARLKAESMLMVLWSSDTKDYSQPGTSKIIYAGISAGQPGAIVLMHDGGANRAETVAALPRIITRLRQRGFHLVTVPQLIAEDPPPPGQPPPHPLSGRL